MATPRSPARKQNVRGKVETRHEPTVSLGLPACSSTKTPRLFAWGNTLSHDEDHGSKGGGEVVLGEDDDEPAEEAPERW